MGVLSRVLSVFAMALACCPASMAGTPPAAPGNIEILWDSWGVPHIYGESEAAAAYGLGWAMMQSHGDLMLELYGKSRGRAAEYWGREFLDSDRYIRTMGLPDKATALFSAQSTGDRERLMAFASGANDFAAQNPEKISARSKRVLPISPLDLLRHEQRVLHLVFLAGRSEFDIGQWQKDVEQAGSNTWAISPKRSASGNALLLQNPHLPWSDLFLFTEAHLVAPDLNLYGVTLIGWPFLVIGFNQNLGWSLTVNTFDGADLYELTLRDGGYVFGDGVKPFETHSETISIREDDGTMTEERYKVRISVHGPVVDTVGDKALALRIAGFGDPRYGSTAGQYWAMGKARNLKEFKAALSQLQMPFCNHSYADRNGNIYYAWNAQQPVKSYGDAAFWAGTIDGSKPELLWTDYHDFGDLPQFSNPDSGYLQNSNDAPWTTTFPQVLKYADYPAYFSPQVMAPRPQHGARLLMNDESISFDELLEYLGANTMIVADYVLPTLLPAARATGEDELIAAAEILAAWDHRSDPDSRGAVLFLEWANRVGLTPWWETGLYSEEYGETSVFAKQWDPRKPLTTPSGLADIDRDVARLRDAVDYVLKTHGSIDVAWGDVVRVRYGGHDLPSSGGIGALGSLRTGDLRPAEGGTYEVTGGNSWVSAIEFGKKLRAKAILAYGNATQAYSGHVGDQIALYSENALRDVWYYRDDVEKNVERRVTLNYRPALR